MNFSQWHSTSYLENSSTVQFDETFEQWEKIILGGNSFYESGHIFAAIGAYSQAITLAKTLSLLSPCNGKSLSTLVTSFHNLADTYLYFYQRDDMSEALTLAYNAIEKVEALIEEIESRFINNTTVMRFASIARQQRFLFLKRYPSYAKPPGSHTHLNSKHHVSGH